MKRLLIVASIMLAFVSVKAQSEVGSVNVRPMLGMNIGIMSNTDGADCRIGLALGAELEYQMTNKVALSGGLLYSQQGCSAGDVGVDAKLKLDYVNVPLLANVYLTKGLAFKLGLQPGFLINDKITAKSGVTSESVELGGASKNFVLALPIGLSYEFSNIQIDARFNWGLTHAINIEGDTSNSSAFMLAVGYKFKIK